MQRIRLSLLLGLLLVASGPAQLASFGREGRLAVGDPIAYAEAVGPDFPTRQPEVGLQLANK
jgi:hypothetical protein